MAKGLLVTSTLAFIVTFWASEVNSASLEVAEPVHQAHRHAAAAAQPVRQLQDGETFFPEFELCSKLCNTIMLSRESAKQTFVQLFHMKNCDATYTAKHLSSHCNFFHPLQSTCTDPLLVQ